MKTTIIITLVLLALSQGQNIDGYTFQSGKDIYGSDIVQYANADVATLQSYCNARSDCLGFTTFGYLKNNIPAQSDWHDAPGDSSQGIYIKNAVQLDGYTFTANMDIYGGDIILYSPADLATLQTNCDNRAECVGFTTFGFLKNNIPAQSDWHSSNGGNAIGVYVKNALPALTGYTFTPNMDIWGNDIIQYSGLDLGTLQKNCDDRSDCTGFTTLGFLKNNIPAQSDWHPSFGGNTIGVYVKGSTQLDGYTFTVNKDIWGNDIQQYVGVDLPTLKTNCDARADCYGFTTFGFIKNNIPPQSDWHDAQFGPSVGVYVKDIIALTGYTFTANKDIYGYDITIVNSTDPLILSGAGLATLKGNCDGRADCTGFTTFGFLKNNIPPQSEWHDAAGVSGVNKVGVYVKNTPAALDNYTFTPNMDIWYNDIVKYEGADLQTLRTKCDILSSCAGFTTFGYLKSNIPPKSDWHSSFGGNSIGVYTKNNYQPNLNTTTTTTGGGSTGGGSTGGGSTGGGSTVEACYKGTYGRGAGRPISVCPAGTEKNGALCYPLCPAGYYGVGPVCWQNCPGNFRDDGAYCGKPSSYGKGAGYVIWQKNKCFQNHPNGCYKSGALWYPYCIQNFHTVGCCVCSPDCPAGMSDIGVSCHKNSQGRGVGSPLTCASGSELSGALCYPSCRAGTYGIGPVCWARCPAGMVDCGAFCAADEGTCVELTSDMVLKPIETILSAATEEPEDAVDAAIETVKAYGLPIC